VDIAASVKSGRHTLKFQNEEQSTKAEHEKHKTRERFPRKAAIDQTTGYRKSDHRMLRNFLKGRSAIP
jgi:IS5 family transposase